ncbi:MAG TPA: urea ABC transporter permease subunit UrtC [Planctomycetota bacterium]
MPTPEPRLFTRRGWTAFAAATLATVVVVPLLNGALPATSALHVSDFHLTLLGKFLTYAILALGMDLIWGYTGILSLGQGVFFALGGYALGMHLMLGIGKLGQYNNELPDFMVFLNWAKLPWYWPPFRTFSFAAAAALAVPVAFACGFGWFAFRSRIRGVYFSIITQALTYALCLLFFLNEFGLGGNNGLTDFKTILGSRLQSTSTLRGLFVATAASLAGAFLLCRWIVLSKLGRVLEAIRDGENRVRFSGYSPVGFKLFVFAVAAGLAGLAGALYVPQVGIINPEIMRPDFSVEIAIWVAVGGRGTLIGPVVGALAVNALKSWLTSAFPGSWLYALGALFIIVVMWLPDGLVSLPRRLGELRARWTSRNRPVTEEVAP